MATLIPAFGSCKARMTGGERRLAERLEDKLDADYLLWYDVPIGAKQLHPDFVVLHPARGLLILEVKDWRLSTLHKADKDAWQITVDGHIKTVASPMLQARHYAHQVTNVLARDHQLVQTEGPHQGKVVFPWSYGVVLSNISRKQFTEAGLQQVLEPHRIICADEITESVEADALQAQLWGMFEYHHGQPLSAQQIDRVRWIMFPQIRIPDQTSLFDESDAEAEVPDMLRVMDLQQEQLARSLGAGHRIIHGVAGSGKTMILNYRAEYLSQTNVAGKPILVLCYNEPLGVKLGASIRAKGLGQKVHTTHFHRWCRQQLIAFKQELPDSTLSGEALFADMVQRVVDAVEDGRIPSGQYHAILIDEGHDFAPEWLQLLTRMVDPDTQSLLLLYDDAQSIYQKRRENFSFKSVGIQAQGRSTILKINYRNTKQILRAASLLAADLLKAQDNGEDSIPTITPVGCGRDGPDPVLIRAPTMPEQAQKVATWLAQAHAEGYAWGDMAVLCRNWQGMNECAEALKKQKIPHQLRKKSGDFSPNGKHIHVLTLHASKGLEFPVVALLDAGGTEPEGEYDPQEKARLLYVGVTRATQKLVLARTSSHIDQQLPRDSSTVHPAGAPSFCLEDTLLKRFDATRHAGEVMDVTPMGVKTQRPAKFGR